MKNKTWLIFLVLFLWALFSPGYAEPVPAGEDDGILLTWQDMRKLLDIDDDKIKLTWKEFQQLLEQSGSQMDMNVEIDGGIVTIKRDRFKQILNKMTPPVGNLPTAPKDYIVTEAYYSGTAGKTNGRFNVRFKIYVFEKQSPAYVPIPVLYASNAVSDITVDGVPGMMQTKGGWYHINLTKSGYHEVKATFSVGKNKQSLSFPIIRSIINTIDFSVPDKDYEINIHSALSVREVGGASSVSAGVTAHLSPMNRMTINWNLKSKKRVKKPALFYAGTHSVISAAPDILKATTTIDLEVLQSSLDTIAIRVPAQDEVVKVTGPSIKDWQVRETDVGRVLEVRFGFDITNRFQFTVNTERMLAEDTLSVGFKGLQVIDARRETGAIGIVAQSAVEVSVQPGPELEKLEFHQLPKKILAMSARPVLYSYKYAGHPYSLDISIHKHQQLEGISTVIESAEGTALFLPEGKM
ncbi:MAG: hypothetical protein GY940_14100, partial [bacterium]|nr:hypothetical protein [bacterium]